MKELIQYIAEDGSIFDTEEECLEYECVEVAEKSIISYDITTLERTVCEYADAIYLHDKDAVEAFFKIADYSGIFRDGIDGSGEYVIEPCKGMSWLRIDDCIEKLTNIEKTMRKDWEQRTTNDAGTTNS